MLNGLIKSRNISSLKSSITAARLSFLFLFFTFIASSLPSASSLCYAGIGTSGAQFLKMQIGPRPVALGGVYAGISDDGVAINYNPAGLVQMKHKEVNLVFNKYFQETNYQYLSYVQPVWRLDRTYFLGISYYSLTNSDIQGYDNLGNTTRKLSFADTMIMISYAQSITTSLGVGLNLKSINETIADEKASAFAADLGFMYNPSKYNKLNVGFCVQNLGAALKFVREPDKLPLNIKTGFGYKLLDGDMVFGADYNMPNDSKAFLSAGLEYWIVKQLGLRLGYKTGEELNNGLRFGMGLNFDTVEFDYAFVPYTVLGDTHQAGLKFRFSGILREGKSITKRIKEHYEKGLRYYWQDDLVSANLEFRYILELDPSHEEALDYTAKIRKRLKEVDISGKVQAHLALGRKYYYERRIVEAKDEFENILLLDPENDESKRYMEKIQNRLEESKKLQAQLLTNEGKKYISNKQYDKALKEFEKLLSIDSNSTEAKQYISLCNIELQKQKDQQAAVEKEKYYNLAQEKFDKNKIKEAKQAITQAMRLDPNDKKIQGLYEQISVREQALGLNKKEEQKAKSRDLYNKGLAEYNKGNTQKAIVYWEEAVKLDPSNINAIRALERAQKE